MKKFFIPMAALALFTLVACGETPASSPAASSMEATTSAAPSSSGPVVMESLTISNKEALQAEWHVGEGDRAVEIESTPKININAAIASGDLKITSSDPKVISVLGRNLHIAGEGKATITVAYGEKSDTVEIDALAMLGEPAYVTGKTLADLMASEKLVKDGDNNRGTEAYAIKVKVAAIGNKADGSASADKYGNMYVTLEDGTGDKVQVYGSSASIDALSYDMALGAYKFPGTKDFLENAYTKDIKAGDVLDVLAIRADYKTTPEISMVIRAVNGTVIPNKVQTTDEVLATELTDQVKQHVFKVTGKITALGSAADGSKGADKYGNMYIKTDGAKGDALQVYGSTATASALAITNGEGKFTNPKDFLENAATKDLKVGDTVTIAAYRCDYQGKIEINGVILNEAEPEPEPEPVTYESVAKLLEAAKDLTDGKYLENDCIVSGVVAEITTAWSDQFKNISFTIKDEGGSDVLTVFRAKGGENIDVSGLKAGDKVTVSGQVKNYQGTIEFDAGCLVTKLTPGTPAEGEPAVEYDFASKAAYDFTKTEYPEGSTSVHFNSTSLLAYMSANVTGDNIVTAAAVDGDDSGAVYVYKPAEKAEATGHAIKFSSSKKAGKVTFTLSEGVNAIKLNGFTWGGSKMELAKIDVNGKSVTMTEASASAAADFLVVLDAAATNLVLTVTGRAVFNSISFGTATVKAAANSTAA